MYILSTASRQQLPFLCDKEWLLHYIWRFGIRNRAGKKFRWNLMNGFSLYVLWHGLSLSFNGNTVI